MTQASTAKKPTLVHEAEVQRQHVRIQIPAAFRIGKNTYRIADLSAGGIGIKTDKNFIDDLKEKEGTLLFPFESFSFNLKVKLEPVYNRADKKRAGFRFENMTPRQVSMIQHVVKSHLSGLIVTEEDIIAVASRNDFISAREEDEGKEKYSKGFIARTVPLAAIAVAGALGLFLLLGNIYENTLIVKSYMGIVEGNVYTASAQGNGKFYSALAKGTEQVTKGQAIAILKAGGSATASGGVTPEPQDVTIESPCDCLIVKQYPQDGEFLAIGAPIFELQPINDYMWVTASLKPEQIYRLKLQDDARIKIAGESEFIEGNVTEFMTPVLDKEMTQVKIKTKKAIPSTLTGRLAYVEFLVN